VTGSSRADYTFVPSRRLAGWDPSDSVIQAYDSHCNLVLGDVEETIYDVDDEDEEEEAKVGNATHGLRGWTLTLL
jgi:hypothetical protein